MEAKLRQKTGKNVKILTVKTTNKKKILERGNVRCERDVKLHGGWWTVTKFDDIIGSVALELGKQRYIKCLQDGTVILGRPHNEGKSISLGKQILFNKYQRNACK